MTAIMRSPGERSDPERTRATALTLAAPLPILARTHGPPGARVRHRHEDGTMAGKALQGLRVLELGSLIGAPFCATLMAEFGADVIKVEDPEVGDMSRHLARRSTAPG